MCDCSRKRDDENVGLETVTIFTKFPTYCVGKNMFERITLDDTDSMIPLDFIEQTISNHHAVRDSVKKSSSSTESSSGSSGSYKFASPTECDCSAGVAEEVKLVSVCTAERTKASEKELDVECTLAIIKPEAVIYRGEIEYRIYAEGFEIYQTRWLRLTPEQVSEFYDDHFGELYFPHLVAYMSSGPIVVHVLAKQNAVNEWRTIIGPNTVTEARLYFPDSIRARYGRRGETFKNAVHGSDTRELAEQEIHFFFPEFIAEPLLPDEKAEDFLWEVINPILVEGLTLCCKSKPNDPVLWLANWLILNNANKPKLSEDLALIPT